MWTTIREEFGLHDRSNRWPEVGGAEAERGAVGRVGREIDVFGDDLAAEETGRAKAFGAFVFVGGELAMVEFVGRMV